MLNFDDFATEVLGQLDIHAEDSWSERTDLRGELGLDSLLTFELLYATEELAGVVGSAPSQWHPLTSGFTPITTLGDVYVYYQGIIAKRHLC
jgi:acyl carrier protein